MSVTFRVMATVEKVIRDDETGAVRIEKILDAPNERIAEVPQYSRAVSIIGDLKP